ncbi:MAG TPA: DUF998 domain-containing protein, partial [Thermoanaerobaculia bacterium]|nr:DUF998 domain-containing protein [Thermoanaerobaculia bacterium]
RVLLTAGIAVPILYYGNLLVSSLFYPGYSHITQYASELGGPDARWPAIFNTATVFLGICGIAAGFGYTYTLRHLTGKRVLPILAGLLLSLFGVAMVMGGLFPMPDERHGAYGLGMAVQLAPLFLWLALRKYEGLRGLKIFLLVTFVVSLVFFAIMMGVGQMVTRANVGVFQRMYSLTSFPWIGIASYYLRREAGLSPQRQQ